MRRIEISRVFYRCLSALKGRPAEAPVRTRVCMTIKVDPDLSPAEREQLARVMVEKLSELYWCGCVRRARWARCKRHTNLDHDQEPPPRRRDDPGSLT